MTRPSTMATYFDDTTFASLPHDAPVEEEKYDGHYDGASSHINAEQWLTRKDVTKSQNIVNENLHGDLNCRDKVESQAELWSARGKRDLLLQWKRNEDTLDETNESSPSIEARSSVSSPGKSSLREKLQRRLQKRHELRIKQMKEDLAKARTDRDTADDIFGAYTCETEPTSPMSDSGLSTSVDHHALHHRSRDNITDEESNVALHRLSRTVRYGRRGELPQHEGIGNVIRLHVYDLLTSDTIMQLPFGCEFPIGKCFESMNNGLHALGTGAYHCGLEINGIEYAYGANDIADATGVFTCVPKHSPGYQHRASIDFGCRVVRKKEWVNIQTDLVNTKTGKGTAVSDVYEQVMNYVDGHDLMQSMAREYRGTDYDLLEKNCCTFARDACLRLGVRDHEIPTWFMNLASAGAKTREAAQKTLSAFTPQKLITMRPPGKRSRPVEDGGIEVILEQEGSNAVEAVKVVDTLGDTNSRSKHEETVGVRRTLSWTY